MTEKKSTPSFVRVPARQLITERRIEAVMELNGQLMALLAKHLPGTQGDIQKLDQIFSQRLAQIAAMEGDLMLSGHGTRGVQESLKLQTKADNDKFVAKLLKPSEEPLEGDALAQSLALYLMADTQQGRAWVVPDESMYGQLVKDGSKVGEDDLLGLADGIYVIKNDRQAFYTLKLTLDDGILIFSPSAGPSLLTYSDLERQYIQHTAFQYANGPKALEKVQAFFANSNVNAVTDAELAKLRNTLRKMPAAKLEGLVEITDAGWDIALNPIFKIRFPAEGEPTIVGARDDINWEDVTLFTRRQMFRDVVARVAKANSDGAPKAAVKKAAKKASAK